MSSGSRRPRRQRSPTCADPAALRPAGASAPPASTFWLLARLKAGEAALLELLNLFLVGLAALPLRVGPGLAFGAQWPYLLGLRLGAERPERRMAFSLFHLASVALFPLSSLCMVPTPNHRSLAELPTGREFQGSPGVRTAAAPRS